MGGGGTKVFKGPFGSTFMYSSSSFGGPGMNTRQRAQRREEINEEDEYRNRNS